ncbi:reverse transcriptase [Phytophthora megakarya]|uniref:Reverse transcriptase n=1 Tax=Phytophthora megakarya TaxID=4795 RepID=A0A225UGM6_9STRA|nr:reverse transcriptase [Phytophthora megakarya]
MSWCTSRGTADSLASAALQRQGGIEVHEIQDLATLNRLDEILIPKTENPVVRVAAVTTRAGRARSPAGVMVEDLIREIRVDRIKQAQEEEVWIAGMKKSHTSGGEIVWQDRGRLRGRRAGSTLLLPLCAEIGRRSRPIDEIGSSQNATIRRVTPRWKEDIMEWGEPTSGSGITSTGGDYTGLFSDMWESVWIVKQENENR